MSEQIDITVNAPQATNNIACQRGTGTSSVRFGAGSVKNVLMKRNMRSR